MKAKNAFLGTGKIYLFEHIWTQQLIDTFYINFTHSTFMVTYNWLFSVQVILNWMVLSLSAIQYKFRILQEYYCLV
jgi:hypothetical protein